MQLGHVEKQQYVESVLANASAYAYSFGGASTEKKVFGAHTAKVLSDSNFNVSSVVATSESETKSKYLDLEAIVKAVDIKKEIEPALLVGLPIDKKEALEKSEVKTKEFVEGLDKVALERVESQQRQAFIESVLVRKHLENMNNPKPVVGKWTGLVAAQRGLQQGISAPERGHSAAFAA